MDNYPVKPDPADYPDVGVEDSANPEWTADDFARARPAREILPAKVFDTLVSGIPKAKAPSPSAATAPGPRRGRR